MPRTIALILALSLLLAARVTARKAEPASGPAQMTSALAAPSAPPAAITGDCTSVLAREPVLIVDWTGTGPLGLMHTHLAVYDGGPTGFGLASISRAVGASGTGIPPCSNKASVANVLPATVDALRDRLQRAGAFSICDDPAAIPDTPVVTVTVFGAESDPKSHTYSNWGAYTPAAQAVEQIIGAFVAQHFPGYGF